MVDGRTAASKVLSGPSARYTGDQATLLSDLEQAVYAAKVASYAQGYMLMRAAAEVQSWDLNLGGIALMWRGGCIIRSVFLGKIKDAFDADPNLPNLLLDPYFRKTMVTAEGSWRHVVAAAVQLGLPVPTLSSALAFYDGYEINLRRLYQPLAHVYKVWPHDEDLKRGLQDQ